MSIVYIASDHRGFNLKEKIKEFLENLEYRVVDLGNQKYEADDDYTDFAINLGEKVVRENSKGILICGSGAGVCIAANKVKGTRASICMNVKQTRESREDDDLNILCLSADLVSEKDNEEIVKTFLETKFSSDKKHIRRIIKIKDYESKKC
jgi:ribose 5-phosphate isomerase B